MLRNPYIHETEQERPVLIRQLDLQVGPSNEITLSCSLLLTSETWPNVSQSWSIFRQGSFRASLSCLLMLLELLLVSIAELTSAMEIAIELLSDWFYMHKVMLDNRQDQLEERKHREEQRSEKYCVSCGSTGQIRTHSRIAKPIAQIWQEKRKVNWV